MYEPNLEDFSDLDDEDVQEEGLNIMSPRELENDIREESDMSALVVEEVLGELFSEIAYRDKYGLRRVS